MQLVHPFVLQADRRQPLLQLSLSARKEKAIPATLGGLRRPAAAFKHEMATSGAESRGPWCFINYAPPTHHPTEIENFLQLIIPTGNGELQ